MGFFDGLGQAIGTSLGASAGPVGAWAGGAIGGWLDDKVTDLTVGPMQGPSRPGQTQSSGSFWDGAGEAVASQFAFNRASDADDQAAAQRQRELMMSDPAYIRERAQASGFNPLMFAGSAFQGLNYAPSFGQRTADVSAMLANEGHQQKQLEIQKSQLELENRRLDELVKSQTINAKVPGIYGEASADDGPPEMEKVNRYVLAWDPDKGRYVKLPNPDLHDMGAAEIATGTALIEAADLAAQTVEKLTDDRDETIRERRRGSSINRGLGPVFQTPILTSPLTNGSSSRRQR